MVATIITGVLALAVGVLAGWMAVRPRIAAMREKVVAAEAERDRKASVEATLSEQLETLRGENGRLMMEHSSLGKEVEMLRGEVEERKTAMAERQRSVDELQREKADLQAAAESLRRELKMLHDRMQEDERRQAEAFERQLEVVREQLKNETRQIMEQRAQALGKSNNDQMSGVVAPLKEQLAAMQKQVNESMKTSTESRASIEKAIEVLMKHTETMADEANNLVRALKNENKTQGNWGEMVLDTLLENSGLEKGVHYETQVTLRDAQGRALSNAETGQRMIPDVIVHYPDGKDVIVDSKVSLTAYLDYCNAETDQQRAAAAERHVISVRQHVKELRMKNYASYITPPRQALQYMIMFVPNETALQVALQHDPTLWREAFEQGICITSEQNLIVLLRMIQLAWTQVQQYENQQQIMAQAKTLLDRVALFAERFNKIETGINNLRRDYDEAHKSLLGRMSVVRAAKEMERLGAKSSGVRSLPELPVQYDDEPEERQGQLELGTNENETSKSDE